MVTRRAQLLGTIVILVFIASACGQGTGIARDQTITTAPEIHTYTATPSPRPTSSSTPTQSTTPTHLPPIKTLTPPPSLPLEPAGCREPVSEYGRLTINGWMINQRTQDMLQHAARLYNGKINITGDVITQGSYNDNGPASFGTHLGGGVVDISVIQLPEYLILYDEIEPLIAALRAAGFAAWLREADDVYPGTGLHIHAVAVGDLELSYPAQQQLTGKSGYFRGFDGLPTSGAPGLDRHGKGNCPGLV